MSGGGHRPGRGRRTVSEEEAELWAHATRALERVKAKPRVTTGGERTAEVAPEPRGLRRPPVAAAGHGGKPAHPPRPTAAAAKAASPPPLAAFEPRRARQVAAGKIEIGARIDLHGLRQDEARARLRSFLLAAQAEGHRTVLVITGKGGEGGADRLGVLAGERPRGVIRRSVPIWLEEADLRTTVLSYTQAGVRHGGAGALYVQLRKAARREG